ncbi:enoyl-CoA hydratase/isomerase family protein [Haliea sp.]|uniref:enoyl-CoA hydratase/isomerase family protein n=1 Tax=Haliea sp. TaxID=1932666 RepID=UPI003526F227
MKTLETLLTETSDKIFTITLNREKNLNALSSQVLEELEYALNSVRSDPAVSVIVIRSKGRAFSSGYELGSEHWVTSQYPGHTENIDIQADRRDIHDLVDYWMRIWRYPKPIVAQVQGDCLSGAGELLAVCDLAIVSERARFGHPAACDLGIPPSIMFWPILIGLRKTKELLLTSKLIDAQEALSIGLVNEVVPHDELEARVQAIAAKIAKAPSDNSILLKSISNTWFENMGMQQSIRTGADIDAIYHQNRSYTDFFKTLEEEGVREAFAKRARLYS